MNAGSGMAGAYALARGAPDWRDRLDMSAPAVFASFWALPLSLPAVILTSELGRRTQVAAPGSEAIALAQSPGLFAVASALAAILSWAGSLLILLTLARREPEGWRISPLIVAYNWSRLILNLLAGAGAALAVAAGAMAISAVVGAVVAGLTVWFDLGVIRNALGVPQGRAIGAELMILLARGAAGVLVIVALGALAQGLTA